MSFQWPLDKVTLINSALALTGDNVVAVADDGSDEWNVCSPAYERGLSYISESHSWGYATQVELLQPAPQPPQDVAWDTAYPIPNTCVHIIWLKINQFANTSSPPISTAPAECLYDIMGSMPETAAVPANETLGTAAIPAYPAVNGPVIVVNAQGGPPPPYPSFQAYQADPSLFVNYPYPPIPPAQITMKYVANIGALCDSTSGTPTMILALQTFIMSGIYRGLHEDPSEADRVWMGGEKMLQMARTRYDQQKPKRQFFNSRISAARRVRRPWPPLGLGSWGGSNTPSSW